METSKTVALKPLSEMTFFQMRAEAIIRNLKHNGVEKEVLIASLEDARKNDHSNPYLKEIIKVLGDDSPKTITVKKTASVGPTYVAIDPAIADVMNAKAIDKKPQLTPKSEKKLSEGKTNSKKVFNLPAGAELKPVKVKGPSVNIENQPPEVKAILSLGCKGHVKIYKLSQINIPKKQIGELVGSNQGHVWNVINDYKQNPEKVTAANLI